MSTANSAAPEQTTESCSHGCPPSCVNVPAAQPAPGAAGRVRPRLLCRPTSYVSNACLNDLYIMDAWPSSSSSCARSLALAEHGSFVRAAAALHISQPALSRSIQNLERSFGSELFVRSSGGVVPTDLGRLYIERARDLLRMADELDREAVGTRRAAQPAASPSAGGRTRPSRSSARPPRASWSSFRASASSCTPRDWDELLQELRSRELDFFVAETSTLQREPDLEIAPMPLAASRVLRRAGRASARPARRDRRGGDILPGRSPRRRAYRRASSTRSWRHIVRARGTAARPAPFPSIQCNGLAPVKRIVATSDAVTGTILSCIATELEAGQFVLLGTEPWLHLQYGIVSLKGRPWTQAAEKMRDFTLQTEQEATQLEAQLLERHVPSNGSRRKSPVRSKRTPARDGSRRVR